MTAHDTDVLTRKLATIQQTVVALEAVQGISFEDYRTDVWRRKGGERFLQEGIEAALDGTKLLLLRLGHPPPPELPATFLAAADLGALDRAFAQQLTSLVELRGWLVHFQGELDDAKVHAALPQAVDDLTRFIAEVDAFLRRKP